MTGNERLVLPFRGSCVDNPFPDTDTLIDVIDRAREITRRTFFKHCESPPPDICDLMRWFPQSYTWYKSRYEGKPVYFYEWSRIEFFYWR